MLDTSALSSFYPVVMTPSHDGKYFHNYVLSLLNFLHESARHDMPMQIVLSRGESLITRARNNAVATFLANPQWTHLFWIDSDIGFSPEAAFRLLLSDHDVAAGVYPLKREDWPEEGVPARTTQAQFEATYTRYTVNTEVSAATGSAEVHVLPDGFIRLTEAPTGFMLIKRCVFERLMAAYPELQYVPDGGGDVDQGLHYRFFDVMVDPVSRTNSRLSHQGGKVFNGNFAASLVNALPYAVGAAAGASIELTGIEFLSPNPPPA